MAQTFKDKTPPHDDELEQAALGSLLADSEAISAVTQLHLKPDDFYSRANQRVFEAVLSLEAKSLRADIQTVVHELKQMGKLDEAGGASYISSLTNVIPSSANIDYYAEMVKNYSLKRALLKLASLIGVSVYDESKEVTEVLEEVQKSIFQLSDIRQVIRPRLIGEVLKETVDIIESAMKSGNPITGVPTGYDHLDQLTSGFQAEEFIIIGARPSVGKTTIALNMAAHIAFHKKIPTAFFSLEMSEIALCQRLISSEAMVLANNLRSGFLSSGEYKRIIDKMAIIYDSPFHIVTMPNMKLSELRTQARMLRTKNKVEIIFIDYLGLITHGGHASIPRFEQISEISRSLKSLARELHVPIVVICQLNRDAQFETPTLAHLRDSGSIEQDADLVMFLNIESPKKSKYDKNKEEEEEKPQNFDIVPTDLIIAKQRNGPVGVVKLQRVNKYAKFVPLTKENQA
ncbi:MAG: replicative DNA helicase [Treponema sp.]|jgi:replicative DNA helicase|nr:replicative DNA helicase [Treponema sp.]